MLAVVCCVSIYEKLQADVLGYRETELVDIINQSELPAVSKGGGLGITQLHALIHCYPKDLGNM